jgi:flagellar hook-associated protein 3
MRVANDVPDVLASIQQSQQVLATDLQQVSTGLRVNQPSDDPAASANLATNLATSAQVDQYTQNISSVSAQLQTTDSAISSVLNSLNSALTLGTQGSTGTSTDRQEIATQVQGILGSVVAQANATYQGVYLFGGSATGTAPVVAASSSYTTSLPPTVEPPLSASLPLTPGSVTTISDAATGKTFVFTVTAGETISDFSAAVASAAAAGTLSAGTTATISGGQLQISTNSTSNGIVAKSNDPVLGTLSAEAGTSVANAYAYVGNGTVNSVQVGDSLNVATNVPGNQIFTGGANVIGAFKGLITALETGNTSQIQNATNAVSTAVKNVGLQRVPLDNNISVLNSQESYLSQEKVTLGTAQTSLVGADLATAATNLAQAQVQNSAVLASAARVVPQTLLNYLAPPSVG